MRELPGGVTMWAWLSPRHGYNFNGYFVRHPSGNLCIDPVEPEAEVLELLAREGVARILLTNRNHSRAAAAVRTRTGAPIAIHPADAAHASAEGVIIDGELQPGEHVGPFEIVGVPGKSPGEIALYNAGRRLLVVGDAVIGNPAGQLSLLPDTVMDDPAKLRASIRKLAALDVDVLLPGDGTPILADAGARLAELVATFPA